jgi:hypothetical protein
VVGSIAKRCAPDNEEVAMPKTPNAKPSRKTAPKNLPTAVATPDPKRVAEIMQQLQNDPAFLAAVERAIGTGGPTQAGKQSSPEALRDHIPPANAAAIVIAFV